MKSKIMVITFLWIVSTAFCQQKVTADEVMKKAQAVMDKQDYTTTNMSYNLFLDYNSKKVYEHYKGYFLKMGKSTYIRIKNTEFVTFEDNKGLKINHDEKAIQFMSDRNPGINESPLELTSYLKSFPTRTLSSDATYFICELKPNKISQIMFSKIILYINKNDYRIEKQLFYFVEKMEGKTPDGKTVYTIPRLEIVYSPRKRDAKNDRSLIKKGSYFTETKTEIKLVKKLSPYKLIKT